MVRAAFRLTALGLGLGLALAPLHGQAPPAQPPAQPATQPANAAPLDQPIAWLTEARRRYAGVQDYMCTMVSRENVRGILQDENVIAFKMKTQPFSVNMRWLAPRRVQGQEVCFVLNRNNNKMRVKSPGISKVAGFVTIDPNDPRVMEHSRHNIYEAGLGNLIDQTLIHWEAERKINQTQVRIAEYNYNNRPCYRIETIRAERRPEFYCYRSLLYVDKESKFPLRAENYDWPRPGGSAEGELLEMYSYVDLRFNVGFSDAEFNK